MKLSRRSVLRLSGWMAAGLSALTLTGCSSTGSAILGFRLPDWLRRLLPQAADSGAASSQAAASSSEASAGSQPEPLPDYDADPLTGEARSGNGRMIGVMVNNISNSARQNARPQRGLSAAKLLIESKVEGNISRLCAVYGDVDEIPEVGPIRSGRDQFLQLLMPWQALYYHDGESIFCTQYIHQWNYWDLNIGGKNYFNTPTHPLVAHRDSRGRDVAYEHTEFTSGAEIQQAAQQAGIGLEYPYESTFFRFADYRVGEVNRMQGRDAACEVLVRHSAAYQSAFTYDTKSSTYQMRMYSAAAKNFEDAVDELNGEQLAFANLLVCFAPIAAYPGDSADVQNVEYAAGGEAYFFTRGRAELCRWEKPAPDQPLKVWTDGGEEVLFNRGKTYLAVVDEDEREFFAYE